MSVNSWLTSGLTLINLILCAPSHADNYSLPDLVSRVEPAIVRIDVERRKGAASGSGFIVGGGWVITNCHVIEGAISGEVSFANKQKSKILGVRAMAPEHDLAVLEIEGHTKRASLELADADPRKGETVVAFGAPMGFGFTTTEGIVSGVRDGKEIKEVLGEEYTAALDMTWVQTTAAISSGNSGGPLVDVHGSVIGINTWTYKSAQNLNFSVASRHAKMLLKDISAKRSIAFSDLKESTASEPIGTKSKAQLVYNHFALPRFEKKLSELGNRLRLRLDMLNSNLRSVTASEDSIRKSHELYQSALDDVRALKSFDPGLPNFLKEDGAILGKAGTWYVFQVISENSLLVSFDDDIDHLFCVKDVSTVSKVDRTRYEFDDVWYTLGETYTYETRGGSSRTVYVFRKFPLEVANALDHLRKTEIEPMVDAVLRANKEPVAPTGAELAELEKKRKIYREEQATRERQLAEEAKKQELLEFEKRAGAKLRLAKQRLATDSDLEQNLPARKYLAATMLQFPTSEAAKEAESIYNNGREDRYRLFRSGPYSTSAALIGQKDEYVVLKKEDGKVIQVPVAKLSKKDQEYISQELGRRKANP